MHKGEKRLIALTKELDCVNLIPLGRSEDRHFLLMQIGVAVVIIDSHAHYSHRSFSNSFKYLSLMGLYVPF